MEKLYIDPMIWIVLLIALIAGCRWILRGLAEISLNRLEWEHDRPKLYKLVQRELAFQRLTKRRYKKRRDALLSPSFREAMGYFQVFFGLVTLLGIVVALFVLLNYVFVWIEIALTG